ncbi:APC family permease [soil metagenome]
MSSPSPALARKLRTPDAALIGIGSMIGAGVFSVLGPAASAAGTGLLVGLLIAGVIAYCNAVASAQLAMTYPTSGGTYIYGREQLGPWWGFSAGWCFVIGKTASCAAMALTVATYALPGHDLASRCIAVVCVIALAGLNYRGVTKTAWVTRVLVSLTLLALSTIVVAAVFGSQRSGSLSYGFGDGGIYGMLQAAGLMFFAFAGYARIATMGEEVVNPARTIPRAITIALAVTFAIYLVIAAVALAVAGPAMLASSSAPLVDVVDAAGAAWAEPVVRVGAVVAGLGALLGLIAGVGRTTLAMARHHDLPAWLSAVHPRFEVPHRAELALAAVVCLLVMTVDLRGAIGFSSFGVLVYYFIANASAFSQSAAQRVWPRVVNVVGAIGCLVLVATLPKESVLVGTAVLGVGLAGRLVATRLTQRRV